MDFTWNHISPPILDVDSTEWYYQGQLSIPPFQTQSRYFYASLGETCCNKDFVDLFLLQFHPIDLCRDCERRMIMATSNLCWQCRTYFRRYGTGLLQELVGVTPQRHDDQSVLYAVGGPLQVRTTLEQEVEQRRMVRYYDLTPSFYEIMLPRPCPFRILMAEFVERFRGERCLACLPFVPMPFYDEEAMRPLPSTPQAAYDLGEPQRDEGSDGDISEVDFPTYTYDHDLLR